MLNLDLDFQNSDPKIHFWAEKVEAVCFARKLAHTVSQGC